MIKFCCIIVCLICSLNVYGQNADSINVAKPLTDLQRDSILINIKENIELLTKHTIDWKKEDISTYKIYRTNNIYNSLKLNTATGRITAVQIGINDDKSRFEYTVCDSVEDNARFWINGRFELYPTGNNYNFILLDTIFGSTYQVQWSTDVKNCGIWRISYF